MITIIEHPLVAHYLSILRNKETNANDFRRSLNAMSYILAFESTKRLGMQDIKVETPLEEANCEMINQEVILIPIIRAGLSLLEGFENLIPEYKIGYIGLKRNEENFTAEEYYYNVPPFESNAKIIILDVMLATGSSTCSTINRLVLDGAQNITIASVISAPEAIERILTEYPKIHIISASLDRKLNSAKFILPGLGDAGDRLAGY
jgi:uracil phosphoribosyltransferase